jgi:hypothetical protein
MGIAAEGIHGAHPHNRTPLLQQGKEQGHRPRVAVFTKDAQPLHQLLSRPLQPLQPLVTLEGHIVGGGFAGIDVIEGVAQKLRRKLPRQHVRIEGQLVLCLRERGRKGLGILRHLARSAP